MSLSRTCSMTSYNHPEMYNSLPFESSAEIPSTNGYSTSRYQQQTRSSAPYVNFSIPQARSNDAQLKQSIKNLKNIWPDINVSLILLFRQSSFRQALDQLANCSEDDIKRLMGTQRKRPNLRPPTSMAPGFGLQRTLSVSQPGHSRATSNASTPSIPSPTMVRHSADLSSDFGFSSLDFDSRPNSMQELGSYSAFAGDDLARGDRPNNSGFDNTRTQSNSPFLAFPTPRSSSSYVYPIHAFANSYPEPPLRVTDGQLPSHSDAVTSSISVAGYSATTQPWMNYEEQRSLSTQPVENPRVPESHQIWVESQAATSQQSLQNISNQSGSTEPARQTPQPSTASNEQQQRGVATRPRLRRTRPPIDRPLSNITNPQSEHAPKRIPCPEISCTKTYIMLRELREHITSEHEQEVQYICQHQHCGNTVLRKDRFKHHHTKEHRSCPHFPDSSLCEASQRVWQKLHWGCNVCSKAVFSDLETWSNHYAHHFQNEHRLITDRSFTKLIISLLSQDSTINVWAAASSEFLTPLQWNEANDSCRRLQRVLEEGYFRGNSLDTPGVAEEVVRYAISCAKKHSPLNSATKRQATRSPSQSTSSGDAKSRENLFAMSSSRTGTPSIRQQTRRY